ncbi:MAG: DUF4920 domain-containing protein [Niabella sp.]
MKKTFFTIAAAFFLTIGNAQPPAGDAKPGEHYGDVITGDGAISLKTLSKKLKKNSSYTGKVVGKVEEVCAKKGCFVTMTLADNTQMQVKFKDYAFFVPTAIAGKTIVIEGEAVQKTYTVEELKHYAEDANKSKNEIDAITKPEKRVKFTADGVMVVK